MPQFGLEAKDRLEPSAALPDIGELESSVVPIELVFWRSRNDTLLRHRNPLFSESTGVTAEESLTVDALHALYLGMMNVFCRETVGCFLLSGIYGSCGASTESVVGCCLAMRRSLFAWYSERKRRFPAEKFDAGDRLGPCDDWHGG